MPKDAVFTMKLEPDLRDAFMAAAERAHRPASQVVRELMRAFVHDQNDRDDRHAFLQRKVDAARRSVAAGEGRDADAVERDFATRRGDVDDLA